MDKLIKALTATAEIYGRKLTDNQIDGYLAVLSGYPEDKVIEALASIIKTNEWFPKPVEILTAMSKAHDPTPLLEGYQLSDLDYEYGREVLPWMFQLLAGKLTNDEFDEKLIEIGEKHGIKDKVQVAIDGARKAEL